MNRYSSAVNRFCDALALGSLAIALIAWWLLYQADRLTLGTLLAFGPRWALLIPLVPMAALATRGRRWRLIPVLLAAAIIVWPVMGLNIPSRQPATPPSSGDGLAIKLFTCNTQIGGTDERLGVAIEQEMPDVVLLQEWPSQRPAPACLSDENGWFIARRGQLLVASRWPILQHEWILSPTGRWHTIALRCELETPTSTINLFCLHLLTPRDGLEAVLHGWHRGFGELAHVTERRRLDAAAARNWIDLHPGPTLIAGDLNLIAQSAIYREHFGDWRNAFSIAGWGCGGTKFTRYHGIRIDHILSDESFQVRNCSVGPDVGSDHRPVTAEVFLKPVLETK